MNILKKFFLRNTALFFVVFIFLLSDGSAAGAVTGGAMAATANNWVVQIALEEGVHPRLVYAVMNQESNFRSRAVSYKGAIGLMQLMPETAARFKVNPYIPQENVRGGCRYLRYLAILFGNRLDLVLAGYNAGEGAVIKYNYQVPPYLETRNYVARILNSPYLQAATVVRRTPSVRAVMAKVTVNTAQAAKVFAAPPPIPVNSSKAAQEIKLTPTHSGFLFH